MPLRTCPHGHQWEGSVGESATAPAPPCPVCGGTAEGRRAADNSVQTHIPQTGAPSTVPVSIHDETLAPTAHPVGLQEPEPTPEGKDKSGAELSFLSQVPTVRTGDLHGETFLPSAATPTVPNSPRPTADPTTPSASGSPSPATVDRTAQTVAPPVRKPAAPADPAGAAGAPTVPMRPNEAIAGTRQIFGGYELLGVLGRGGMGIVYKARQMQLHRLVALKMILGGTHAGPDEVIRFRHEAEAVARLQHPNIVQIYEVGEEAGRPFFSLEFVNGGSLDKKLNGTPQPPRRAAQLVVQLARAMDAAHQRGVVHRDLKPANVLLQVDEAQPEGFGIPKITDFGLAKQMDGAQGHTQTGSVMGTPSYMAPEQAAGKTREIGPAADVYALGAILYDLLTGRPPFRGETVLDTLQQV